jgi:hypothetical protein
MRLLNLGNVGRLQAFLAVNHVELYFLSSIQAAIPILLN